MEDEQECGNEMDWILEKDWDVDTLRSIERVELINFDVSGKSRTRRNVVTPQNYGDNTK